MASATTDAQRLIALSLGKIATGRSQRGGVNLHKNLLVAGVLHKARTVIMIENYQAAMQSRVKQVSVQNNQSKDLPSCKEGHLNRPGTPVTELSNNSGQCAKRLAPGNPEPHEQPAKNQRVDTSDKENNSPNTDSVCSKKSESNSQHVGILDNKDSQNARGQSESCLRCVKRRHAESTEDSANKRIKTEQKTEENSREEPMQVESQQITNLVACFNTGFTGLLNHIGSSESDSTNQSSDGHLSSCATQIKSGFSPIPTPVLALSV